MRGKPIVSAASGLEVCAEIHRACRIAVTAVAKRFDIEISDPDDIGDMGKRMIAAGLPVPADAAFWGNVTKYAAAKNTRQPVEEDVDFLWDLVDEIVDWSHAQVMGEVV